MYFYVNLSCEEANVKNLALALFGRFLIECLAVSQQFCWPFLAFFY